MSKQLTLRRDMTTPLPELAAPAFRWAIATAEEVPASVWEWILKGATGRSFDRFLRDTGCRREHVFFLKEHAQAIATVSVRMQADTAVLHALYMHPWGQGRSLGRFLLGKTLEQLLEQGVKTVSFTADATCLPALKTCLNLGFEPVIGDAEEDACWKHVLEALAAYEKKAPERIILWPEGHVPFAQEGDCVPAMIAYPSEGSKGAVVVCPGGGYHGKASHEGGQVARMLSEAGISAYVLDYRVYPCHREAPLSDAKRAIRTLRAMGYEKVGILGFSAGGHLTCSAATLYDTGDPDAEDPVERLSARPDAFIPCYAVVSFTSFRHQGSVAALLKDEQYNYALLRRFSAELQVNADTPPAFIWHTMSDAGVPVENSINLAAALSHAGVPFELHLFPEGPHGLGLAGGDPSVGQWPALCRKWLLGLDFGR